MLYPHECSKHTQSPLSWLDACTAAWSGGLLFAPHAALLACAGGLAYFVHVCLRWLPALVSDCLGMPDYHVSV